MAEEKSILLEEKEEAIKPDYSPEEEDYLVALKDRLVNARDARNQSREEWDLMDYRTQYEECEKLANTFIKPKLNKEETNFQSGVIRQKIFALLSATNNLDLSGDISAFDADGFKVQGVGDAMEDIIFKTKEYDNDDEKKLVRQYELLKHGTVFVEEMWDEKTKTTKKTKKFKGKVKGFDVGDPRVRKAFSHPTRNVISGINVYLGDMTKYDISDQPYIFTVNIIPYEEAKRTFGKWERWKDVSRKVRQFNDAEDSNTLFSGWSLIEVEQEYVEVLRYQDKWNNEFAILLNGVLMTPIGLPLPWGYEDYNIVQQNLEPIHSKFAYGKSLVMRTRNKVALLDEFMRLAILKTQKSYAPPYLNVSGRMISQRVFMPGKITHGIAPGTLVPLSEKEAQGVTNSELAMIQEIQESINAETVSPTFQGQQAEGDPTATEIIALQRQAKMVLGLTIFAVSMLEWKLEWLRLKNLLANWFTASGDVMDTGRGITKSKYRKTTTKRNIEGEGQGERFVIPTDNVPSGEAVKRTEDLLTKKAGMPIRIIFLNPAEVKSSKLVWNITIKPRERKTSETSKLMHRAFLQDVLPLGPNMDVIREKTASVWEENPEKLFAQDPEQLKAEALAGQEGAPGAPATGGLRDRVPTPEKSIGQEISQSLKVGA